MVLPLSTPSPGHWKFFSATDIDIGRAHQVIPRSHLRGNSFGHSSAVLNDHLRNIEGLVTKDCETFSNSELEKILVILESLSVKELGEIYEKKNDNRMLSSSVQMLNEFDKDRDALKELQEMNHSDTFYLSDLSRNRKCTQAVMRYAHHLTDSQRRDLHSGGVIEALPLLPNHFTKKASVSNLTHTSKKILDRYAKTMSAIQCHVAVDNGCPGGDLESCLSICPGVPDPSPEQIINCRATCTEFCSNPTDPVGSEGPDSSTVSTSNETQSIDPPYWGDSWQVMMSRNSTRADGSDAGFRACMRWYDWTRFALRTDCTNNGVTTISLHVREKLYQIFTSPNQVCLTSDLEVTPVAPYWLQEGASFVGVERINDVETYVWDKKEGPGGDSHLYKVAANDGRPIQMLTTGPDGSKNQKDYVNYLEVDLNVDIFKPPPSCDQAKEVPLEQMLSLPDVVIDM